MIVVDASVALARVLDDSDTSHRYAADVAAAKLEGDEELIALGVRYLDQTSTVAGLVRFAVRRHVQGCDAVYLALAIATGSRLATLDGGLRTAARAAGVELFTA